MWAILLAGAATAGEALPRVYDELLPISDIGVSGGALGAIGGDINGDGYDDLVIAWNQTATGTATTTSVVIVPGSASGLDTTAVVEVPTPDPVSGEGTKRGVAAGGDVDGDGYDDFYLGIPERDAEAGAVYLVRGGAAGVEVSLVGEGRAAGDWFGGSIAGGGDVNGDGYGDVVIGAPSHQVDGINGVGEAWLYLGEDGGFDDGLVLGELTSADDGDLFRDYGWVMAMIGDLDGDGYDDFVIGYHCDENVCRTLSYGGPDGVARTDSTLTYDPGYEYGFYNTYWYNALTPAGDVDADGYADFVMSAAFFDDIDYVFGATSTIYGEPDGHHGGASPWDLAVQLHGGGFDFDADGYDDVAEIMTPEGSLGQSYAPYLFLGGGDGLDEDQPLALLGPTSFTLSGHQVLATGDWNGDSYDDLALEVGSSYWLYEGAPGRSWFRDADGDGYGDPQTWSSSELLPEGYVDNFEDCDDADPNVHPGAVEYCDGVDNDCDGDTDGDDALDPSTWYQDLDQDDFGTDQYTITACDSPSAYADNDDDCDDLDAEIHPGAPELCNGKDDDCDDVIDPDSAIDAPTWHADADHDGFGAADDGLTTCEPPDDTVSDNSDCDDTDPTVYPGADEVMGDGIDQDCDASTDESAGHGKICGCASTPGGSGWLTLLWPALLVWRRRDRIR